MCEERKVRAFKCVYFAKSLSLSSFLTIKGSTFERGRKMRKKTCCRFSCRSYSMVGSLAGGEKHRDGN